MSDSQYKPWSDSPNAPKIPYSLYILEKDFFAGFIIGSILYGMLVVLFFQCMFTLLNPVHRYRTGGGMQWGLLCYIVVMFSLVTVLTAMNLNVLSILYIDNRDFPGVWGALPPGPLGYQVVISSRAINIIPNVAFNLNNWLADGLLLRRCHVLYGGNLWVVALPYLMYLTSLAMGILSLCPWEPVASSAPWNLAYLSTSLSLNVILTLMIVGFLLLARRRIRRVMKIDEHGWLFRRAHIVVVESSAIFAVSSLLVIGPWVTGSPIMFLFLPALAEIQAIASLLTIKQVLTRPRSKNTTNKIASFEARSRRESTGGSGTLPASGGYPMRPMCQCGMTPDELGAGVETTTDIHWDWA